MMYTLAVNYGSEGWSLTKYDSEESIMKAIKSGDTFGQEFRIFIEVDIMLTHNKEEL